MCSSDLAWIPQTLEEALEQLGNGQEELATELYEELEFCIEHFVDKRYQHAVRSRPELVRGWPRPRRETSSSASILHWLTSLQKDLPASEPPSHPLPLSDDPAPHLSLYWPGQAAPMAVALWASPVLSRLGILNDMVIEAKTGFPSDIMMMHARPRCIPSAGLALVYLAEQEIGRAHV